jgi:hypothetical protein
VLTGREAGVVDMWDWSYQLREPATVLPTIYPAYLSPRGSNSQLKMMKMSFFVSSRPSVVLTGREAGMVDTWDWSYQIKEPAATNKISNLSVSLRLKFTAEND